MFPMKKLALASFFLAVLVVVAMNPDISKHHQESVLQGKQFLQEKAAESGFSGSIIHWGSQHLAEMGIEVQSYTSYGLFSTAEIFVSGYSPRRRHSAVREKCGFSGKRFPAKTHKKRVPEGHP